MLVTFFAGKALAGTESTLNSRLAPKPADSLTKSLSRLAVGPPPQTQQGLASRPAALQAAPLAAQPSHLSDGSASDRINQLAKESIQPVGRSHTSPGRVGRSLAAQDATHCLAADWPARPGGGRAHPALHPPHIHYAHKQSTLFTSDIIALEYM